MSDRGSRRFPLASRHTDDTPGYICDRLIGNVTHAVSYGSWQLSLVESRTGRIMYCDVTKLNVNRFAITIQNTHFAGTPTGIIP